MAAIELAGGAALGHAGRYRLKRVIATGGMASVWLALDERLQRPVAVKVLSDMLALDAEYVARFEREARVAAQLSHPQLVRLFDFDTAGPRPFLVMEYVSGGSLQDGLDAPALRELDPERLVRELLGAVAYIHRAGIIHRDIKPANVLIDGDGHARLTDFGIAQPADATRLTRTGMVLGSGRYIAPEIWAGQPASISSDLYACGILIQECMPAPPGSRLAKLAAALTAPEPERRPASAADATTLLADPHPQRRAVRPAPASTRPRAAANRVPASTPPRTAATNRMPAAASTRPAPARPLLPRVAAVLAALVAAAIVTGIVIAASSPRVNAAGPVATPPHASLRVQLTSLERAVGKARR